MTIWKKYFRKLQAAVLNGEIYRNAFRTEFNANVERSVHDEIALNLTLTDGDHPNTRLLAARLRNLENISLNIKFFGYELARHAVGVLPVRQNLQPLTIGLKSKASTQADLESEWVGYWLSQLRHARLGLWLWSRAHRQLLGLGRCPRDGF
jgi:hypothetical protein